MWRRSNPSLFKQYFIISKVGDKLNIYENSILESIDITVKRWIEKLKLDYTITGKVAEYDEDKNIYTVLYNGGNISVKAREGLTLEIGDIVYIRVVRGNFSEKFIDCKKP